MENVINPIAAQVVDNAQIPNSNGIQGSLPGETKAETQARLYKVMVDGEELEVNEDELKKGYSHSRAAAKRMEESSKIRREAEEVLRLFQSNPREAFKIFGKDARQFAEQIINEELQEALLSPQEKELRQYKQQLAQYQSKEKEAREKYEKEQQDLEMARYTQQIQDQIIQVLNTSGLPQTERTIGRIAYYMQSALQAGFENVTPADVIEYVKKDYQSDLKSLLGGLSEDQIEMFLDTDIVRRIAKSTVKGNKPLPKSVPKEVNKDREETPKRKIMSPKEFFKHSV